MTRTLRHIRQLAPSADRDREALAAYHKPHWAAIRSSTRYSIAYIYPRTLDELRDLGGDYGSAAVIDLRWSCVITWLMNGPRPQDLTNPIPVVLRAVHGQQAHDRIRQRLPRHDGKGWSVTPLMLLERTARSEAARVAADTADDWDRAGKPHLGPATIKRAYQSLISTRPFRDKYFEVEYTV